MAQRSGSDALLVLQDALEASYPEALSRAIRAAKRRTEKRTGRPSAVLFAPTLERAVRKYLDPDTQRFYAKHHWPFVVTSNPNLSRPTVVVVWDTENGRDVHHWVEIRKRRVSPRNER